MFDFIGYFAGDVLHLFSLSPAAVHEPSGGGGRGEEETPGIDN